MRPIDDYVYWKTMFQTGIGKRISFENKFHIQF